MAMTQPQINFCETYLSNGYNALDAYFAAFPNADKTNRRHCERVCTQGNDRVDLCVSHFCLRGRFKKVLSKNLIFP